LRIIVLTAVFLTLSISIDVFIAFFTYGARGMRVPPRSIAVTIAISAGVVLVSGIIGAITAPLIPDAILRSVGFTVLFIIGIIRLFDSIVRRLISRGTRRDMRFKAMGLCFLLQIYADPEAADIDAGGDLSTAEAIPLALAMSIDGAAAGFASVNTLKAAFVLTAFAALFSFLAIIGGKTFGAYVKGRCPADISPIGGVILIILAFSKLIV